MPDQRMRSPVDVEQGLGLVCALVSELRDYCAEHPIPSCKILLRVALQLNANALALEQLLHTTSFSAGCLEETVRVLEPVDGGFAANLRRDVPALRLVEQPVHLDILRRFYMRQIMEELNMLIGMGRRLLEIKRRRDAGQSESEIESNLRHWVLGRVF